MNEKTTPEITHMAPPHVCLDCAKAAEREAETNPDHRRGGIYCPHGNTLGLALLESGTIIGWQLHGPCTYDQAQKVLAESLGVMFASDSRVATRH